MDPIELTYSEELIRRAVRSYWARQIGFLLPIVTLAMAVFLVYLFVTGDRSWLIGAVAAAVALAIATVFGIYVIHHRRSMAKLAAMGNPTATLTAGDDHLRIESGAGASELPWTSVDRVWRYDDYLLVYLDSAAFFTIPTIGVEEAQIRSLQAKFEASGAKVA